MHTVMNDNLKLVHDMILHGSGSVEWLDSLEKHVWKLVESQKKHPNLKSLPCNPGTSK